MLKHGIANISRPQSWEELDVLHHLEHLEQLVRNSMIVAAVCSLLESALKFLHETTSPRDESSNHPDAKQGEQASTIVVGTKAAVCSLEHGCTIVHVADELARAPMHWAGTTPSCRQCRPRGLNPKAVCSLLEHGLTNLHVADELARAPILHQAGLNPQLPTMQLLKV